jgi:Arc/MetJ-type ribon-helix-helix transcriptional regulator
MASKSKYVTVSLPTGISDEIDELIDELGYWPSRGAFVREACLTKIREEKRRLKELRDAEDPRLARNRGKPKGENGLKKGI